MNLAYDPMRVRALARYAAVAIDELAAIRSWDDAATFALDVTRAARRHLEDDWMSLLSEIVASTAMTEWWQRHQELRHPRFPWVAADTRQHTTRPNQFESMADDELLRLVHLDGLTHGTGPGWSAPDFADPFWATLPELAADLARRSSRPDFAAQLIADVHLLPLVAMSVPLADFDPDLVAHLAIGLLTGPPIESGITHRLHRHALDATLRHLMASAPGAALDVMADPAAMLTLASWDQLDQQVVHDFVRVGLYDSVAIGARTVDDGIGVITTLIDLANGPLEAGMGTGASRGIAESMYGYVHTIAHGIGNLDDAAPVLATNELGEAAQHLGTVADMRDLFGSVLRDEEARSTLATVLGAYTDETVGRLGPRIASSSAADDPIKFGLLLDAAAVEEQIEIDGAAAADSARRQRLAKTIGFGLGLGLGVLGFPSLVGNIAKEAATRRSRESPRSRPKLARPLGPTAHEGIVLSVLSDALAHPDRRRDYGLADLNDAEWNELSTRLATVGNAVDDLERHEAIHDLRNHVEHDLPTVDRLIVDLSQMAGMDHLQFGGIQVDAD